MVGVKKYPKLKESACPPHSISRSLDVILNMEHITKLIFLVSLILANFVLISCEDEPVYNQLISDQLRHLYLIDTTYTYSGETEEFTGTVQFLKNAQQIIDVKVTTRIRDFQTSVISTNRFNVRGISEIELNQEGFRSVVVEVHGSSSEGNQDQLLYIGGNDRKEFYFSTSLPLPNRENPNTEFKELDTALVNGIIYNQVYKFTQEDLEQYQFDFDGFDRVYFAKDFGYILIETLDGLKLELITE